MCKTGKKNKKVNVDIHICILPVTLRLLPFLSTLSLQPLWAALILTLGTQLLHSEATSRSIRTPLHYVHLAEYDSGRLLRFLGAPRRAAVMDIQMSTMGDVMTRRSAAEPGLIVFLPFDDSSCSSRLAVPQGDTLDSSLQLLMYCTPPLQVRVAINDLSLSLSACPGRRRAAE